MSGTGSTRARIAILLMVTGGGVAALSWETLWQLHSALALGVSAFGAAVTLAGAMAGMTLGAVAMGRWLEARKVVRPLRVYGLLELLIGSCGLLLAVAFRLLEDLDSWVYGLSPALAPYLQVAGILIVLGPASAAMGATVPVFTLAGRAQGLSVAVLYACNTGGAAVGVLAFAFFLLPHFGMSATARIAAAINFGVFALAMLLPVAAIPHTSLARDFPTRASEAGLTLRRAGLLVFGSGFVTFGLEVAWFRSLRAAFASTTESFAIMLASVLVPLALAARLAPWLRARGWAMGVVLALAGVAVLLTTPLIERMDLFAGGPERSYLLRLLRWMGLALSTIGPAMLCLGVVLPWCLEAFPRPAEVGRLYALNTLGAVAGSLLSAWLFLPTLGFARSAWIFGMVVIALALWVSKPRIRWAAGGAAVAALWVAMVSTSSIGRDRVQMMVPSEDYGIVAYQEAPDSTVSVVENAFGRRSLLIDGFVATSEYESAAYMDWMGRLPMLLHEKPERALVICFGTGQTAHAVRDEGPLRLDIVDVSSAVLEMAPYFSSNHSVLDDSRTHSVVMDGRAWIRRTGAIYDVVTLEPMAPFFAGVNALYSKRFYELVAEHLASDGVVAQWLPTHLLAPFYAESVAATFQSVFPDAVLWLDQQGGTAILLGRLAGNPEPLASQWPGLAREAKRPLTDEAIARLIFLDPSGLARFGEGGEIITDDNQLLAYSLASGDYYAGGGAEVRRQNMRKLLMAKRGY